jgi:hypothetical protein
MQVINVGIFALNVFFYTEFKLPNLLLKSRICVHLTENALDQISCSSDSVVFKFLRQMEVIFRNVAESCIDFDSYSVLVKFLCCVQDIFDSSWYDTFQFFP